MHPVDEVVFVAAEVDGCDLSEGEAGGGGQEAADVEIEVCCDAGGRLDVGDLAGGVEAVLREDGDFVGADGGVGGFDGAGDLYDAAGGETVDGLVVIPLGLSVDLDGEVAAVGSLNYEGLSGGVDADDGGVEVVDVATGVGGRDCSDVEGGSYIAGDLSGGAYLDGFEEIEVHAEADGLRLGDDERRREWNCDCAGG